MSDRTADVQATRAQQRVEELAAASLRALAGEADLHFRGRRLHRGRHRLPLYAPHLHPRLEVDDEASFRGAADGLALRIACSDDALHRRHQPAAPVARLLFDMLEQYRVESLADSAMPGVRHNLRHRFEAWLAQFHASGAADTQRGILLFTIAQIARTRLTGDAPAEETEDLMEATRAGIVPALGHELAALKALRHDQEAFGGPARALAERVATMLGTDDEDGATAGQATSSDDDDAERAAFALVMELPPQWADGRGTATAGAARQVDASGSGYHVFTTAYDQELRPAALARPSQLREWREQLDRRIAAQGVHPGRLARDLKALLAEPQREGWNSAQEEGLIDGRRLAQLVARPSERRLFRTERIEPVADCVLAFLVDCSGSMREHIESVAMLVEVTARALEQAGVASEILGFSTGAWHGGRARRDWVQAGRPARPGRLAEVAHFVFKDADTPWRRARPALGAMLKPELFKEGIDGEAVDWACGRLRARDDRRKLLVVVSDGCPMEGATAQANGDGWLDEHLLEVVARHEQAGQIQVFGLGVGLDLSPWYSRAQAIDLSAGAGQAVFRDLVELLGARRWR